jgi:hypothetical protein
MCPTSEEDTEEMCSAPWIAAQPSQRTEDRTVASIAAGSEPCDLANCIYSEENASVINIYRPLSCYYPLNDTDNNYLHSMYIVLDIMSNLELI